MAERRIVITGMGAASPLGVGWREHWEGLCAGRPRVQWIEGLRRDGFPVAFGAPVAEEALRASRFLPSRKQLKLFNRATLLAVVAAAMAAEEAALASAPPDPERVGILLATLFTPYNLQTVLGLLARAQSGDDPVKVDMVRLAGLWMADVNPVDFSLKVLPNLTAGHIAIALNIQGRCGTLVHGWTGGLQALGEAYLAIRDGGVDVMLAGGAEAPLDEQTILDLATTGLLAQGVEEPATACCPFDLRRRGLIVGEGAGIVILEELEHARRRGAPVLGEVVGYGASAGVGLAADGDGIARTLAQAIGDALRAGGLEGRPVDFIHANGDSTPVNDRAETRAIKLAFGPEAARIPIAATKSMQGHLFSGAGPVEAIASVAALARGVVPPTVNLLAPDPDCDLDYVVDEPRPCPGMGTALVNAIGPLGEAAAFLLRRWDG